MHCVFRCVRTLCFEFHSPFCVFCFHCIPLRLSCVSIVFIALRCVPTVFIIALTAFTAYSCVPYEFPLRSIVFPCVPLRIPAFHCVSLRSVCSVALPTDHYCVYCDSVVFALRSLRSPCVPTVSRLFILVFPSLPCCSTVFLQLPCAFYQTWDSEAPHPLIVHSLAHS